uniref:fibrillin-2-like isoform X2 n=1 Tax=Styela clava TaxID=7725 RepID=UPI00193ABB95|nr:fibrillin-2-like isoform X2 [Styela clava]
MKAILILTVLVVILSVHVDQSDAWFVATLAKKAVTAVSNFALNQLCKIRCTGHGDCRGGSQCMCDSGWKGASCAYDINECTSSTDGCAGTCTNSAGSFTCSCPNGKTLGSDGKSCNDVNECEKNTDGCAHVCHNNDGSFTCSCNAGFKLGSDGKQCVDVDECQDDLDNCAHKCINEIGDFSCDCDPGYTLATNGHSCNDINECDQAIDDCDQVCTNHNGGYTCSCRVGFNLASDKKKCEDRNECEGNVCHQLCYNEVGSYSCGCDPGYVLEADKVNCADIDECKEGHNCEQTCENQPGSYTCTCKSGYKVDDHRCHDINECETNNGGCAQVCTNELGKFSCSCEAGYEAEGSNCNDLDECTLGTHECDQTCTNTEGSYTCSCAAGYISEELKCFDIDECTIGTHDCAQICTNIKGSFECSCSDGFASADEGRVCNPICTEACQNDGICVAPNVCNCTIDFHGEVCSIPKCYPPCDFGTCEQLETSNECKCDNGWDGKACDQDIDECYIDSPCGQVCNNLEGSYFCSCNEGYALSDDQTTCIDVDECSGEHGCEHNCNNVEGSFSCSCNEGWSLGGNNFNCKDVNECEDGNHGCEHTCINNNGSFTCLCNENYYLWQDGKSCYEIVDEWTLSRKTCQCYYDPTKTDCACCIPGGCQCDSRNPSRCVQCGYGDTCAISIDEIAAPCFFNNSKLGKLVASRGQCDTRGRYVPRQCDNDGNCFCVSRIGIKIKGTEGADACENPYFLDGWTLPGNCQCDHDPTKMNCACCRNLGCQCPNKKGIKRCVQCGLSYLCDALSSYYGQFDFSVAPHIVVKNMNKQP